jgi:predicted enzyme related to lactoylglutathione lyase
MERAKQGDFATVDLAATDLERQTSFYEGLFGWTHSDVPTDKGPIYRMFTKDGGAVAGGFAMSPDMRAAGMPTMWNSYVAVDDVDAMVERAVRLGGHATMPAADASGYGRFAGIEDPTGGMLFLWHSNEPDPSAIYGVPGALAWNDLSTRDPEAAAAFFADLFGWAIQPVEGDSMPYWMISVDGTGQGGIMPMPEMVPEEVPAYWLVYFGSEDTAAAAERTVALGGSIVVGPVQMPGMTWAVVTDPEGATFGLLQMAAD